MSTVSRHIVKQERALDFIIAGKAKFTLVGQTHRFTYYVMQPKFNGKPAEHMRYVKVMDVSRANDLTYIGLLKFRNGTWEYEFRTPNVATPSFNKSSLEV